MIRSVRQIPIFVSLTLLFGFYLQAAVLCQDSLNPQVALEKHQSLISELPQPSILFRLFGENKVIDVSEPDQPRTGEGYFLLKQIGETWQSKLVDTKNIFAVKGDPTWPLKALSPKLSYFFGLRLIDSETIILPNTNYLNRRIRQLNDQLIKMGYEPIALTFLADLKNSYLSKQPKIQTPVGYSEMFTSEFVQNGHFPLDRDEVIHDLSFHFLNILFTEKQLAPLFERGRALLIMSNLLRSLNPSLFQSKVLQKIELREELINLVFQLFSVEVDNASGLATIRTLARQYKLQNKTELNLSESFYLRNSFSKGISGQRHAPYLRETDFTLGHWLNFFFKDILEIIEDDRISEYPGVSFFNGLNATRNLKTRSNEDFNGFKSDLRVLLTQFWEQNPEIVNTVIARFDDDGKVIDGGLTPSESSIDSFFRRMTELETALDKLNTSNDKDADEGP